MSAKTSPARRRAFFAALAATGNQTLAAERAKVSRSWVSLHRAEDPAFRAEMDAAIAAAKASFDTLRTNGGTVAPRPAWRAQDGEELVVRGSNGRRAQVARARLRQWTPRLEARFLQALAQCCNVKRACAAVGLSVASAYNHRNRWRDFAERWDEAVEDGFVRLECAMVDAAGRLLDPDPGEPRREPDLVLPTPTIDEVLQLMRLHRLRAEGPGRAPGRVAQPPSSEDVDAKIKKGAARIKRVAARRAAAAGKASGQGGGEDGNARPLAERG